METLLRADLEPLPSRMQDLPIDDRGFVVPWFVAWENGKPEFRAMDPEKFVGKYIARFEKWLPVKGSN